MRATKRLIKRQNDRKRKLADTGIKYDFEAVSYVRTINHCYHYLTSGSSLFRKKRKKSKPRAAQVYRYFILSHDHSNLTGQYSRLSYFWLFLDERS